MIKYDNKEFRNLVEQVQENKEQIAEHWAVDRVLADFGIKIIGTAASYEDIENIQGAEYGDAYAVGTEPPYTFYIWTHADVNAGHPEDYWLNIGELAIVGPQGPQGPQGVQGPKGDRGSLWYITNVSGTPQENDVLLNSNGDLYTLIKSSGGSLNWTLKMNIRGPQGAQGIQGIQGPQGPVGPQGAKGDKGDTGGLTNIVGILTNADQLPTPSSLNDLTKGYLVGTTTPYNLYLQVGNTSATAVWTDLGPLNVGTLVSVGGNYENVWDADTKLDKVTTPGTPTIYDEHQKRFYTIQKDGTQSITKGNPKLPQVLDVAIYDDNGNLQLPSSHSEITKNNEVIDVKYFNEHKIIFFQDLHIASSPSVIDWSEGTEEFKLACKANLSTPIGIYRYAAGTSIWVKDLELSDDLLYYDIATNNICYYTGTTVHQANIAYAGFFTPVNLTPRATWDFNTGTIDPGIVYTNAQYGLNVSQGLPGLIVTQQATSSVINDRFNSVYANHVDHQVLTMKNIGMALKALFHTNGVDFTLTNEEKTEACATLGAPTSIYVTNTYLPLSRVAVQGGTGAGKIPQYTNNNTLAANTPQYAGEVATKGYVDDLIAALKQANNLT